MAVIREHLAHRGLGLHNDLQNESSVVGNFPFVAHAARVRHAPSSARSSSSRCSPRTARVGFGLTEPDHGSDATWMETTAVRDGGDWVINGAKRWNSGMHSATHDVVFARTSGTDGSARGITAFFVPADTPGFSVDFHWWTLNMPTDHAEVTLRDVRVPDAAIFGEEGGGLAVAQTFVHENRIRQAASGRRRGPVLHRPQRRLRPRAPDVRRSRWPPGRRSSGRSWSCRPRPRCCAGWCARRPGSSTACRTRRSATASRCATTGPTGFVCDAADRAMQVHGGLGYSRHTPFEHIYRHHRRYRITEGAEEVQMRKVAAYLFGFAGPNKVR